LIKFRPWVVQYDTRILPHHVLTVKQLARHKRLSIFNPMSCSDSSKKCIALNIEDIQSTATSGFITSNKEKSSPYFCLLHNHKYTSLYHSHNWNKPNLLTSIYYMKNTTLSPDLNHFVFNMQTDLNSRLAFPVPKTISDPNLILNLSSETRRKQD